MKNIKVSELKVGDVLEGRGCKGRVIRIFADRSRTIRTESGHLIGMNPDEYVSVPDSLSETVAEKDTTTSELIALRRRLEEVTELAWKYATEISRLRKANGELIEGMKLSDPVLQRTQASIINQLNQDKAFLVKAKNLWKNRAYRLAFSLG